MPFDPSQLSQYPLDPGVYLMKNKKGAILYIGKANSLRKRLQQYFIPGKDTRLTIPALLSQIEYIETIVVSTEKEALLLENTLIKKHQPKYNILLKDDKNYISLSLDLEEPWPQFRISRMSRILNKKNLQHFGPYTNGKAAKQTFELMAKLFPLRQCSNEDFKRRTRPCLLYDIKRCLGPCVHKCTKEEYNTFVTGAVDFLQGNNKKVLYTLKQEMQKASKELSFEKAASLLRIIKQIEHVTQDHPFPAVVGKKDIDVLGLHREGQSAQISCLIFRQGALTESIPFFFAITLESDEEILSSFLLQRYHSSLQLPQEIFLPLPLPYKEELSTLLPSLSLHSPQKGAKRELVLLAQKNAETTFLQQSLSSASLEKVLLELQETAHLSRYPKIIESYDISHLSGSHPVAAIVVFIDGKEDKKLARNYHIKDLDEQNDYAALHQVLSRRLLRAKETGEFPDLLLIDGGKGQLHVTQKVLQELDLIHIDILSLVKEKGRHDKGLTQERVCSLHQKEPIPLTKQRSLLFFLQRIRDRAHHSALSFQRATRNKAATHSQLENLPGIGPRKKIKLLQHFGSWKNLLSSSQEELEKIPGLTKNDIQTLVTVLKS